MLKQLALLSSTNMIKKALRAVLEKRRKNHMEGQTDGIKDRLGSTCRPNSKVDGSKNRIFTIKVPSKISEKFKNFDEHGCQRKYCAKLTFV